METERETELKTSVQNNSVLCGAVYVMYFRGSFLNLQRSVLLYICYVCFSVFHEFAVLCEAVFVLCLS